MDCGLKGKVALVTAASKGLGKAVALELSKEYASVIICSRNDENLKQAKEEISQKTGKNVKTFIVDITNDKQVKNMMKQIRKEFNGVDILVNNAGGPPAGMFDEFSIEDYRNAIELNLISAIRLTYAVIPYMKSKKWGRIINNTSVSAKQPLDNLILSNTARAGVLGFTKSISNQLAPFGITANAICPGYTKTGRVENLAKSFEKSGKGSIKDFYQNIEQQVPMQKIGTPEEFAKTVVFLASQNASYITGIALQIDGGFIKSLF
ncbi:MAG: SDR family oxidoreductase [Candidatus Cloacimonetes bacterium]|nr:SDR family oxidoreductase [Candidatus Cloacimonadota bacterium]MBL7107828.1 SDR family oxidoreductase [Candidatus Cloacimonadota bacterium]